MNKLYAQLSAVDTNGISRWVCVDEFVGEYANKCIYEIITQCIENKINILMKIKLQNCKICNLYF